MKVTFSVQTKSGIMSLNYMIFEGVSTIEGTIQRIEENPNYKVLAYEKDGELVIVSSDALQGTIPAKGRGYRFRNYWTVIKEYCPDKSIARLAEIVWWGRATGRIPHLDEFLDLATASKICKFLVKNRSAAQSQRYEDVLRALSL